MPLSCDCSPSAWHSTTGRRNFKITQFFINKTDGLSTNNFQRVHNIDISIVEDLLTLNVLLDDIDIVDWNNIGELARRSVQKYEKKLCYC